MECRGSKRWAAAAALLLGGLLAGCSGSPGAPPPAPAITAPAETSALTVHLVRDGAAPDLAALNLDVSELRIRTGGLWRKVPLVPDLGPVDLAAATREAPALLVQDAPWPDQESDAFQLVLGTGCTAATLDAEGPLAVPAVLAGLMGPPGAVAPSGKPKLDLWITVDLKDRILADQEGNLLLRPPVARCYDLARTGTIRGILSDGAGHGLEGVTVAAEAARTAGPSEAVPVFRSTVTEASGAYTLDLLDVDTDWVVVAGGAGAAPEIGPVVPLGLEPYADQICNLEPATLELPGTVQGTAFLPPGTEGRVDLVVDEAGTGSFAVQSAEVLPDGTFAFAAVAPGDYRAILNRLTLDAAWGILDEPRSSGTFTVDRAGAVTVNF